MANLFLGIDSGDGVYIRPQQTATLEAGPANDSMKVERLIVEDAEVWAISSLIIDGRELVTAGTIPASAFVGNHPLFVEAEIPKGSKVKIRVTNKAAMNFRFLGVLSGPELDEPDKRAGKFKPLDIK